MDSIKLSLCDFREDIEFFIKENNLNSFAIYSIRNKIALNIISISVDNKTQIFRSIIEEEFLKDMPFELAVKKHKIIEANNKEKFLSKSSELEIYIPIELDKEDVGFIVLSSKNPVDNIELGKLQNIFEKYPHCFARLAFIRWAELSVSRTLIIIDMFFSEKSRFMKNHIHNVQSWSTLIAQKMGYSNNKLIQISLAALAHDIGKIAIDSKILNKEGSLTKEEFEEIKKHVDIGYHITKDMFNFYPETKIPLWIYQHHEKYDGSGYPLGLKGEEIEEEARILKIADSLDAILSQRSYKPPMNINQAIFEIERCKGKDFDPKIAEIAIDIIKESIVQKDVIIDEYMLPASVVFYKKEKMPSIQGYIFSQDQQIIFQAINTDTFTQGTSHDFLISVEKYNSIYEYLASGEVVAQDKILITQYMPVTYEGSFEMNWILEGVYVSLKTKQQKPITITKISADYLWFSAKDNEPLNNDNVFLIVIEFEDGTKIPAKGKIINTITLSNTHYKFSYVDMPQYARDLIFRQILNKQREIHSGISKPKKTIN
ncbi:MAG: HD-GYP domain-containing protein [Desulfurella sp.]|uniref:HD-GYP domain-containing protein n=1 Tax=Desulfurella sp. TaxID=1962857 RepID=UPI003D12E039